MFFFSEKITLFQRVKTRNLLKRDVFQINVDKLFDVRRNFLTVLYVLVLLNVVHSINLIFSLAKQVVNYLDMNIVNNRSLHMQF